MSRRKYQRPTVYATGKREKLWKAEWRVYVKQPDGSETAKHHAHSWPRATYSKAEAQEACDRLVRKETGAALAPDGSVTLNEFWSEVYYPVRKRKLAYNTRLNYVRAWPESEVLSVLNRLLRNEERATCLMCSEGDFLKCHRHKMLAPLVRRLGYQVQQITPMGALVEENTSLVEPPEQGELLFDLAADEKRRAERV